jgi:hypothetical protein
MKLTGPVASIIVALIIVVGLLFGAGALTPQNHTYAKASFDGGYMLLGVIKREAIYSNAEVTYEGTSVFSGSIDEVIAEIENSKYRWPAWETGVSVKATAGIQWTGSEGDFKLTTDQLERTSKSSTQLTPQIAIDELKALLAKAKQERTKNAQEALSFGPPPLETSLASRLIGAVR